MLHTKFVVIQLYCINLKHCINYNVLTILFIIGINYLKIIIS